jgi:hypothetical protein
VLLVAFLVVGCVAVQGRRANSTGTPAGLTPAAVSVAEARQVLRTYAQVTRRADQNRDARALDQVETGAALVGHVARLHSVPAGRAVPHIEVAAQLSIPRLRGYPKWFAAGNGPGWIAVFERRDADAPWRATSVTFHKSPLPRLATRYGNAVAVSPENKRLRIPPGKLADRHAAAIVRGERATAALFADHRLTSGLAHTLTEDRHLFSRHGWAGEEHAADPDSKAFALRTEEGDAVVWYSLRVADQFTNRAFRYRVGLKPGPARLLGQRWVAEQVRLEWRYGVAGLVPRSDHKKVRILGASSSLVRASGH